MERRRFLRLVSLAVAASATPTLAKAAKPAGQVMTVLGPVPAGKLGRVLMHEHVMVDFIGADKIAPGRYNPEEVFRVALPYLQRLKYLACQTLVECTPDYIGRDAALLRRLSRASGLHILTNTGFYGAAEDKYVPRFAHSETADQLALRWAREFEDGIPPENVRPGFMKIGVDSGPLSEIDTKLVRAAARCHQRTGLAIASHTGNGIAAMAELELLKEEGVEPSAFIWVHAQNEKDSDVHERAAALGAWVEFDGVSPKTRDEHVQLVMAMKRAGRLHRTLISQDAGWYNVGEPGGGNYRGYEFLFTDFLPALRKAGATKRDIDTLLIVNPRLALTLRDVA